MDQKLAWAPKGVQGIHISGIKKSKRQVERYLQGQHKGNPDRIKIVPVCITEISEEEKNNV